MGKSVKAIFIVLALSFLIAPFVLAQSIEDSAVIEELETRIAELLTEAQRLQELLNQLKLEEGLLKIPSSYSFDNNLKIRDYSQDVQYLQILLNQDPDTRISDTGWGSPGQETMYFGAKTQNAVIRFKQKYSIGLGTGYVGPLTIEKLNEIIGIDLGESGYIPYSSDYVPDQEGLIEGSKPQTFCGDGIIQTPSEEGIHEVCDGSNLNNNTCVKKGYLSGTLSCSSDCLTFNTKNCVSIAAGGAGSSVSSSGPKCGLNDGQCPSGCTRSKDSDCTYCGDNTVQKPNNEGAQETCDGTDLNNQTCQSRFGASWLGNLSCSSDCQTYITTGCTPYAPSNHAPVLNNIPNTTGTEGKNLTFFVLGSDADNDTLSYSVQGLPAGASFSNKTFSWTPAYNQAGIYTLIFVVSDGQATDSQTMTITVYNINRAPVLNAIGSKTVSENNNLSFTVSGTDLDNDTLYYSIQNKPAGASFSNQTFSWTPSYSQSGTYTITFIVSDQDLTDTETIVITVNNVCVPTTCASQGKNCGTISDGCSGTLNCGSCQAGYACSNNVCMQTVPIPTCGDGACNGTETCSTCSQDCGSCPSSPATGVIYVDNQLTTDCVGTYSITNRNCSGSDGDAYNTPQEAANAVNSGDTVYFRDGTYYNPATKRVNIVMNVLRSGTLGNPITFTNYNNEKAILSGLIPSGGSHAYTVVLGVQPDASPASGQGVQNIIIDGLIIEGASERGLLIAGPTNQSGMAQNPTENIIIRNVIFRNNVYLGGGDYGGGLYSEGTLVNVLVENCEAYDNAGTGIAFGRIDKTWHSAEQEDEMSAAHDCIVRNCLSYNNINPAKPGDTDGISGSHMYNCTFEDNVMFGNSDDGLDFYASIQVVAKNNIIFNHNYPGGNNGGLKFAAGGGGRHLIANNIVFNNPGPVLECSDPSNPLRGYYPSKIYNNLAYDGATGIALGITYDFSYPGFDKVYMRNNILLDNTNNDVYGMSSALLNPNSNYNFISNTGNLTTLRSAPLLQDVDSLTGNPGLVNKNIVINTTFVSGWTLQQKLDHIRSQVAAAFSLDSASQLIDAGTIIPGYHCATSGPDPSGNCEEWSGTAPDIGAYEYQGIVSQQCSNTDSSCGIYPSCINCNSSDGCYGTSYRDYYCSSTSCVYTDYSNDSRCFICTPGATQSCSTGLGGICSAGTKTCQANGIWGGCAQNSQPTTEICTDSLDNDCDGAVDCNDSNCSSDIACQVAPPPSGIIPADYISWWKLENNVLDEKGVGNGTIIGNPQFVAGLPNQGQALSFGGISDYINIGHYAGIENQSGLTISAWIKSNSNNTSQYIITNLGGGDDTLYMWIHGGGERIDFRIYNTSNATGTASVDYSVSPGSDYTLTDWHHIVGVYNGSQILLYKDAVLGTPANLTGNTQVTDNNLYISYGSDSFNGLIDNVMIFNRALTLTEIQNIYNGQIAMVQTKQLDFFGIASMLNAIQSAINALKSLF